MTYEDMKTPQVMIEHIENSRAFFNDTVEHRVQRDFNMRCRNLLRYHTIDDSVYIYFIKKFFTTNNVQENQSMLLTAFDKVVSPKKLDQLIRDSGTEVMDALGVPKELQ